MCALVVSVRVCVCVCKMMYGFWIVVLLEKGSLFSLSGRTQQVSWLPGVQPVWVQFSLADWLDCGWRGVR